MLNKIVRTETSVIKITGNTLIGIETSDIKPTIDYMVIE